jgi:hypothetical protein
MLKERLAEVFVHLHSFSHRGPQHRVEVSWPHSRKMRTAKSYETI